MVSGAPPSPGLVLAALNVAPGGGVGWWRRFRGVSSRSRTCAVACESVRARITARARQRKIVAVAFCNVLILARM
eukprot:1046698-Rhodomonas_salina.1